MRTICSLSLLVLLCDGFARDGNGPLINTFNNSNNKSENRPGVILVWAISGRIVGPLSSNFDQFTGRCFRILLQVFQSSYD